jgi:hypothetical protein
VSEICEPGGKLAADCCGGGGHVVVVVVVVVALRGGRVLFVPVTDMSVGSDYVGRCVFAAVAACWGSGGHDSGSCC